MVFYTEVEDIVGDNTTVSPRAVISSTDGLTHPQKQTKQEVKVIWQIAPHGGPIPRLGVTPGGRNLYHWIPGVGFPISVP